LDASHKEWQLEQASSVLITGANRGIGRAIALDFLARGHRVAAVDLQGVDSAGLDDLPGQLLSLTGDARITDQINAAFDQADRAHGPVEVAVLGAGIVRDQLLLRLSDQDLEDVVETNLVGAVRCARRAIRSMLRAKTGRIVLVGSVIGHLGGVGQANYAAAKAGLVGLARSITLEVASRGITANVVAPGFIETDMTASLPPERRAAILDRIPSGRFGTVDDVVAAVRYAASPEASYLSGAVIPVDGGLGMGH